MQNHKQSHMTLRNLFDTMQRKSGIFELQHGIRPKLSIVAALYVSQVILHQSLELTKKKAILRFSQKRHVSKIYLYRYSNEFSLLLPIFS